jgi:hypothetical protein
MTRASRRILSVAAVAIGLVLGACSLEGDDFSCTGFYGPQCSLRKGGGYLGFYLGMSKVDAFRNACAGMASTYFTHSTFSAGLDYPAANRFFMEDGPVKCNYADQALTYDYWDFRSNRRDCVGPRENHLSLQFKNEKLERLVVGCGVIDT